MQYSEDQTQQRFDIRYTLETPEGVDLQVELAGTIVRSLAFVIDFLWRCLFMTVVGIIALILGENVGLGVWLLMLFLVEWFYPVLFEVLRHGQTPGKKSLGIMVINEDLTPVSWGPSFIRNLLRAADFLPFGYMLGIITMTMHKHFQRFGDIAAGTIVIHKRDQQNNDVVPDASPVPPPFELNEQEQTAIVEFTLRHKTLSDARQQELASILEAPMQKSSHTIVEYLRGIGVWLLGGRK